tara:strand:+ start:54 stop:290 length:237 start_codon:yes stop_codon:yes gene_type:complete
MQHHSLLQALMEKVEAVRLLLSLSQPSIDINKNPLDYSALGIMATQNNHTEFVQLLTEAGARQSLLLLRQQHATKQQK